MVIFVFGADFILTEEQRKDMSLEEQLKDLNEKLEMTQAIKSGSKQYNCLSNLIQSSFLFNCLKICLIQK